MIAETLNQSGCFGRRVGEVCEVFETRVSHAMCRGSRAAGQQEQRWILAK